MKKTLRLISLKVDQSKGSVVNAIALVGQPAIASNFISFAAEKPEETNLIKFDMNSERMELLGAAMIPNLPMYRNTKDVGEYMAVFEKETIREIAQVFAEQGFLKNMNIDHTEKNANSFVFQSFIVDEAKGIFSPKGIDAPDGSWIVGVKVNDPKVWEDIKSGKTNGFSVEGFFDLFDTSIDIQLSKDELALAEEFEKVIEEHFSEKMGCLMFFPEVNTEQWKLKAIELVPNALEVELEPHITILYGFTDYPTLIDELKSFLQATLNESPLDMELGRVSKFIQPEQDVVKIDIWDRSGTLTMINTILSDTMQIISKYGKYKPHMTIAYSENRPETAFSPENAQCWEFGLNYINKGRIVYSDANGVHTDIMLIK